MSQELIYIRFAMTTVRNEFSLLGSDLMHKRISFEVSKEQDLDLIISMVKIYDRIQVDELAIPIKLCNRL
jgi:hypothetical protein